MIIPYRDFKLSHFQKTGLDKKIFVLSRASTKNSLSDINTHLVSYKMLLTSCVDKEYVMGFDMKEELLVKFKKDYSVYEASVGDILEYCSKNRSSLMIMNEEQNKWTKINYDDSDMSLFYIQLREDS